MKVFCIISIVMFFLSVMGLFKVKLYVQQLDRELMRIKNEIYLAQSDLKVLQAEWSYLNNPRRLTYLATKYLTNNSLIVVSQIKSFTGFGTN